MPIDMSKNVEVWVCRPDVAITTKLNIVMFQFEVMDAETLEGTGKSHGLAMETEDAMQLLRSLQFLQKRFDLPEAAGDPTEVVVSPKGKN